MNKSRGLVGLLSLGLVMVLTWSLATPVMAIDAFAYRDAAEEIRFRALTNELRCTVCQNQNLADSDASLARDLRLQVLELMREGKSDDEIKTWLADRYGDFVLYRPPFKPQTWVLWLGPAALLGFGALVLRTILRTRQSATQTQQESLPADEDSIP